LEDARRIEKSITAGNLEMELVKEVNNDENFYSQYNENEK
jgi:hypothetical protein